MALRELRNEVRVTTNRLIIPTELVQTESRFIHRFGLQLRIILVLFCRDLVELLIRLLVVQLVEERLSNEVLRIVLKIGIRETVKDGFECLARVFVVLQFIVQLPNSIPSVFNGKTVREVLNQLHELRFSQLELLSPEEDMAPEVR